MALQYFSEERIEDLKHLYSEDKLFRTFSPVLCELQEKRGELHPVILWHEVDALRERLRKASYRETEVPFLVNYLRGHLSQQLTDGKEVLTRDEDHVVETMLCVLLLLFFQLSDATPSEDKLEENPNHVVCKALAYLLANPDFAWYIEPMRKNLTMRKTDLQGNKIVLPVTDYMQMKVTKDAMDEIARQNYERIMAHIAELSKGLKQYLKISEDDYMSIWENICMDGDLFLLMSKKEPRTYPYEFNIKMFCNVLGLLQHTVLATGEVILLDNVQNVNNAISEKNYRPYLTYYNVFDSNCAYTKPQMLEIKRIIGTILELKPEK